MKRLISTILGFLTVVTCAAQVSNPSIILVSVAPSGACSAGLPNQQVASTGVMYSCQNGVWATAASSPTATFGTGNNIQTLPMPTAQGFGAASFTPSANNPISATVRWHGSLFVNSDGSCDYWYYGGAGVPVQYVHSTDAMCETWSAPVAITGGPSSSFYMTVTKSGSTYYLVISDAVTSTAGKKYYLYASTNAGDGNAGTWSIQNSGNPIFTASVTTTDWYYDLYNPTLWINGSTWVLAAEAGPSASPDSLVGVATTTGCPSSCNFNTGTISSNGVFPGVFGNPEFTPVPDASAIVMKAATVNGGFIAFTASSSSDPTLPASWTESSGFYFARQIYGTGNTGITDGTLAFAPSVGMKPWNGIFAYVQDQADSRQAYTRLTLDEWYQALIKPWAPPVPYYYEPTLYYPGSGAWNAFYSPFDASLEVGFQAGLTADANEYFRYRKFTGTVAYYFGKNNLNDFTLIDPITGIDVFYYHPASVTQINAGGVQDVRFNANNFGGGSPGTGGVSFYSGGASPTKLVNIDAKGAWIPTVIYSAAGTALPTCNSAYKGAELTVSDATAPSYMGAYTSGGAITAQVICSYNGTTYSWLTH